MGRSAECQLPFRLTRDHYERLDKAARYCGQTKQAFVLTAVLAEIAEVEDRKRMKQLRVSRSSSRLTLPDGDDEDAKPNTFGGGGLADLLRRPRPAVPTEATTEPVEHKQAPVIVNVGGGGNGGQVDLIDRLAAYVLTGNDFERDMRLRTAVSILHASSSTEEERKTLAARLDEAVATKSKTRATETGGVIGTAKAALGKIAGLLGGD